MGVGVGNMPEENMHFSASGRSLRNDEARYSRSEIGGDAPIVMTHRPMETR